MSDQISEDLRAIRAKLDQILVVVEEIRSVKRAKAEAKKVKKEKLPPLTDAEIKEQQTRFTHLFDQWMDGHEIEVQSELEKLDVDQLRRFGDANNLNVTSKMSAQKVLQLISARFREKRQLLGSMVRRRESSDER
jgi:hypothetical protein